MRLFPIIMLFLILGSCSRQDLSVVPGPIPGKAEVHGDRTIITSPNTLQHPGDFIWGASVIQGDDGKYHMLYATWDTGPDNDIFSNAWVLYSEIRYAVSEYPDHGFKPVATILRGRMHNGDSLAWDAQAVHNPHIKRFSGKYYLYYIGNRDPGPVEEGIPGWALNKRNRCQQNQYTGVIAFENFEDLLSGNFVRPEQPLLVPRTRVRDDLANTLSPSPEGTRPLPDNLIIVNPSVVRRPTDGKYLLYFKGNMYDKGWRGVHGVAIGDTPEGPFVAQDNFVFDIRNEDGTIASAEDPFVWYNRKHGQFYAIIKDFSGKITGLEPGLAILSSQDGLDWRIPENGTMTIRKEITFSNGDIIQVKNLERPQLLLDRHDNPLVLYAACSVEPVGSKRDGTTFNVHIPLR